MSVNRKEKGNPQGMFHIWDPPTPSSILGYFPDLGQIPIFSALKALQRWILGSPQIPNTQLVLDEIFTVGTNQQIRQHHGLFVSPGLLCASHLELIGPSGQFATFTFGTALVSSFTFGTFWDPPTTPSILGYWGIYPVTGTQILHPLWLFTSDIKTQFSFLFLLIIEAPPHQLKALVTVQQMHEIYAKLKMHH